MTRRRQVLRRVGATTAAVAAAGCLSGDEPIAETGTTTTDPGATDSATPGGTTPRQSETSTPETPTPETETRTERPTPTSTMDVPDSLPVPTLGEADAPVRVDAYEDFDCPYCHQYHSESFGKLAKNYIETGKVTYVFHDFPVVSAESVRVAIAASAVQHDAGESAFWEFADAIYERSQDDSYLSSDLGRLAASKTDADEEFVANAVKEKAFAPAVEAEKRAGSDRGVDSVPTLLVEGTDVPWDYGSLSAAIDARL